MTDRHKQLSENLARVQEGIAQACQRSGRRPQDVRLVAVTKTVDIDVARELVELGQSDLGENRVQELLRKDGALADTDVVWHMIGHLQTNKVRKVLGVSRLIHAVDSIHLAEEINRRAGALGTVPEVLLEVNVSGEEAKFGLTPEQTREVATAVAGLSNLKLAGLMTMAPFVEDAELTRPVFVRLRKLRDTLADMRLPGVTMKHLSMGMTQDYTVAVEEGATLVRVGSALFAGIDK